MDRGITLGGLGGRMAYPTNYENSLFLQGKNTCSFSFRIGKFYNLEMEKSYFLQGKSVINLLTRSMK